MTTSVMLGMLEKYKKHSMVTDATSETAKAFIDLIPFHSVALPKMSVDGSGGLLLIWQTSTRTLVTIDDERLHYVTNASTSKAEYHDNIPFDGTIPEEILQCITG